VNAYPTALDTASAQADRSIALPHTAHSTPSPAASYPMLQPAQAIQVLHSCRKVTSYRLQELEKMLK